MGRPNIFGPVCARIANIMMQGNDLIQNQHDDSATTERNKPYERYGFANTVEIDT